MKRIISFGLFVLLIGLWMPEPAAQAAARPQVRPQAALSGGIAHRHSRLHVRRSHRGFRVEHHRARQRPPFAGRGLRYPEIRRRHALRGRAMRSLSQNEREALRSRMRPLEEEARAFREDLKRRRRAIIREAIPESGSPEIRDH